MTPTYINSGFSYKTGYDDPAMRGTDDPRPWNLTQQILDIASQKKELLDIGCGTALKLIDLARHFAWITGLDSNPTMLEMAQKRLSAHDLTNSSLILGSATALPFKNESFDVVTSMVAPHNINEIFRILRPGGHLIIETVGEMDKRKFKNFFFDEATPRGQLSDRPEGFMNHLYKQEMAPLFENVTVTDGFWNTHYSKAGLLALLLNTPTIKNFAIEKDQEAFERALAVLPQKNGLVTLTQHRLLAIGRKP